MTDDLIRKIDVEMLIPAPVSEVWKAWTTREGIRSFFARDCNIEARPDGPYEIFFNPAAAPGQRGADEMRVLAVQPERMLSFTWNAPTDFLEVRRQRTHVTLWFTPAGESQTRVRLVHDGWGEGDEWDQVFAYFEKAWAEVVLPRLKRRFEHGPIEWEKPRPSEER